MDIGDILVLIFILSGIVSSFFGGKKPQTKGKRPLPPRPRPRPQTRAPQRQSSGSSTTTPAPAEEPATVSMNDILRELGLPVEVEQESTTATKEPEIPDEPFQSTPEVAETPPPVTPPVYDSVGRPMPRVRSLEGPTIESRSYEELTPRSEARHQAFHDQFVRPLKPPKRRRPRRHPLRPDNLREAILFQEILGTPKGLREDW